MGRVRQRTPLEHRLPLRCGPIDRVGRHRLKEPITCDLEWEECGSSRSNAFLPPSPPTSVSNPFLPPSNPPYNSSLIREALNIPLQ